MNPFEALAQKQMVAAAKARHPAPAEKRAVKVVKSDKDAPMKPSAMEQDQLDKNTQLKLWRAFHRAEVEAVANAYGEQWRELVRVARAMSMEDSDTIVDHVKQAQWLREADLQTRRVALSMISRAIINLREANGYAPFDDSLPGEEPTVFEIIREKLKVLT